MKRVFYILSDLLIIALLAGAYLVQYFTKKKLGMSRWVVYQVMKAEKSLPIGVLRFVAPVVVLLLVVLLFWLYGKRKKELKKIVFFMVLFSGVLAVFYLGFTVFLSRDTVQSYYLVLPLIGLANVVQILKTAIAFRVCKNEE